MSAEKEQTLFEHKGLFRDSLYVNDISADGRLVLFQLRGSLGASNLWLLRQGASAPEPFSKSKAFDVDATFSPDGKWVAYQRNEAGQRATVYVQPYPATGGKFQISRDVGFKPLWRSDGKELFFLNEQGLMSVAIETANGFHASAPRLGFEMRLFGRGGIVGRQYGVTRDGHRFLVNLPQQESKPQTLTVTTNWLAAARK